jgi:hypothetical protein
VPDVARLLQAFVSPAIFVSAAALLLLSLNARLMGIVTRLRQFHREKLGATRASRTQEAEALADQIRSIEQRAERIRKACLLTLVSLSGTIVTCLLLGLGLYWPAAQTLAAIAQVLAIFCLLLGTLFYAAEITVALSSVRDEAKFFHLIDLGALARTERRGGREEDG